MLYQLLLLFLMCSVTTGKVRYDNFSLYHVTPKTEQHFNILKQLEADAKYDFWNAPRAIGKPINVLVSPEDKIEAEKLFNINDLEFNITIEDVQSAIDKEAVKKYRRSNIRTMTWDAYFELDDIYQWMKDLSASHPNFVTSLIGGVSVEGRNIEGIKISYGANKRSVFIECGIHAREWISPATCTYIANDIINSVDTETRRYAEEFDWYIFPVTNPDGYVWSFTEARLWRKNRKLLSDGQYGVDLNRNFDGFWMVTGASNVTSSETYAGTHIMSEPETRSLANFIETVVESIDLYLSFHSAAQLLLIPYGHTSEPLDNYDDAKAIGDKAVEALAVRYGIVYEVGNIAEAIYEAAGTSIDYVKYFFQVPLVYCYELRSREHGFFLPTQEIMDNNLEIMDSLLAMIREAKNLGYMNGNVSDNLLNSSGYLSLSLITIIAAAFACIMFE